MSTALRIILASQSPARRKLMKNLMKKLPEISFESCSSDYHENMRAYKNPSRLAAFLAFKKAEYIARKFSNAIIIGADTFITVGTQKIGKPSSIAEAKKIIGSMSGKTIKVYSGIGMVKTDSKGTIIQKETAVVITRLKIKKMSPPEINKLAHAKEALQISGAFSIEGEGGKMVEKIDGDYNNVIGLPLFKVKKMINRFLLKNIPRQ